MSAKRILVVEDHGDSRYACVALLSHFGYEVAEAVNGVEALAAVQTQPR